MCATWLTHWCSIIALKLISKANDRKTIMKTCRSWEWREHWSPHRMQLSRVSSFFASFSLLRFIFSSKTAQIIDIEKRKLYQSVNPIFFPPWIKWREMKGKKERLEAWIIVVLLYSFHRIYESDISTGYTAAAAVIWLPFQCFCILMFSRFSLLALLFLFLDDHLMIGRFREK